MTTSPAPRRLAVIEVTLSRPHAPEYHAFVGNLNARLAGLAEATGWEAARFAASDLGRDALLTATDGVDAIVVMGGEDVAPTFYDGASGYEEEGLHFEEADEAQIAVVERSLRRGTPLLGICRGHQIVNVALGGSLLQHIGGETQHKNPGAPMEELMQAHGVDLLADSALASMFGRSVPVQSAHHQALERVADGLRVVGIASDGVVEAVEHQTAPIMGVQWHPEDRKAPAGQLLAFLDALTAQVRAVEQAA